MIKSILVPVRGDGMVATVLAHAAEVAKRHKAHVKVVHCRAAASDLMPQGIPLNDFARKVMLEQAGELANRQEDHLRGILRRLSRDFGLTETDNTDDTALCTFTEEHGRMADVVKHAGRLSDIIVLPKPQRERNLGQSSLKVQSHGPDADELVAYYALRGVTAEIVQFDTKDPATGLLQACKDVGASLLVIGAYSHSHETEMLFGGNTERIVDQTEMPILMAH